MVKAARRAGWAMVEKVPKTAPQGSRFLAPFHRYRDLCGSFYFAGRDQKSGEMGVAFDVDRTIRAGCITSISRAGVKLHQLVKRRKRAPPKRYLTDLGLSPS